MLTEEQLKEAATILGKRGQEKKMIVTTHAERTEWARIGAKALWRKRDANARRAHARMMAFARWRGKTEEWTI